MPFKAGEEHEIRCPFVKCFNTILGTRKTVETHLLVYDEDGDAVEECESEDEVEELLRDLYPNLDGGSTHTDCDDLLEEEPNVEANFFYRLLKDFEKPLYENSKASKLFSLIKLLHIKSIGRWSNASFTMLLKLLTDELLPDDANLPNSYYEAKKIIQELGLSYNKIDACTNDCMLYWKEDSLLDSCKICGASRWRINSHSWEIKNKKVDPRNVRLGLASDGFQPFRNSKTSHSIWPVVLIPYNLPPWLCMKQENFILSMLIPGPNGPGKISSIEFAQTHENARHMSDVEWNKQFIEWFKDRVAQLHKGEDSRMMEDLLSLSRGPTKYSTHSNGYVINGYRYHVEDYDKKLRTQNCGVVVLGENDKDSENLDYYGVLTDVIELQFVMDRRVVLFRCNWFDVFDEIKGVKKDKYDFVSVNLAILLKTNEPFVLANQASQVFYGNDNSNKGWQVAMKTQPHDSFEIVEQMDDDIVELRSPSKKKQKRTNEMKPIKTESEDNSTTKSTMRYTFVAPGAIGKGRGRGRGLKSLGEKGSMPTKKLFSQSNDLVNHYIQEIETRKTRGQGPKISTMSASLGMETMHKNALTLEKENMKSSIPSPACTNQVKQYTQEVKTSLGVIGKGLEKRSETAMSSQGTRSNSTMSSSQEMRIMDKNPLICEEDMQINISLPPSVDQVMKHSETTEKGSSNPKKVKRVRGSNICKEVAALEIGQKLTVTFYNNRTVGTNIKLFLRHLGKIVRDCNIFLLGVSSWNGIKQENLNHMWADVEHKFEVVDMNDHRDHI
ncbi:hypothetical protein KY285_030764 [Solanum tuberosum]|nr:hypothetical protein KY284_030586 [Solanum tuberosum]KAH0655882.1 hypothetical protein KY285_030764 [Solanum tuberosum]